MHAVSTILPPHLLLSGSTLYASQGGVSVLEARSGILSQHYSLSGVASLAYADEVLYLAIHHPPDSSVQALQKASGTSLWSYRVKGRLSQAPIVTGGTVYASTVEGDLYALEAHAGILLWHATIEPASLMLPSPTVVDDVVFLAPQVQPPAQPTLSAFRAQDGTLLWQATIPEASSSPLVAAEGALYLSTSHGCLALRGKDGSVIWQHMFETSTSVCAAPLHARGRVYLSLAEAEASPSPRALQEILLRQQPLICALQASDGSLLWQRPVENVPAEGDRPTAGTMTGDLLCVGTQHGTLFAYQADDGTPLWHSHIGGILSSPIGGDGAVYVGASDGSVYALRATDGTLLWQTFVGTARSSTQWTELDGPPQITIR